MKDELSTATVEWAGWRFEITGIEQWAEFDHPPERLEISGVVTSAERIEEETDE